jgi:putative transposase
MIYTKSGEIAIEEWHRSFKLRQELFLDEFILMPDHLHTIVVLDMISQTNLNSSYLTERSQQGITGIKYSAFIDQRKHKPIGSPVCHRKPKSISSFIAGY